MLPRQKTHFKVSPIALSIVVASMLLAVLVLTMTNRNLSREQQLMENFLLKEGQTLIRSFEAGARTSLRHNLLEGNPLATLVEETSKTSSIAYIRITNEKGRILASAGAWPQADKRPTIADIIQQNTPLTTLIPTAQIFEIARVFQPLPPHGPRQRLMRQKFQQWCEMNNPDNDCFTAWRGGKQIIFIGLHTAEFDQARQEDVRHSWIMGGILFLLGWAGLYFLFLYQSMRVTRATLADMELYTKNVIESMPDGLITLDKNDHIFSCNAKAEELIGQRINPRNQQKITAILPDWSPSGHQDTPVEFTQPDGNSIPVQISTSRLCNPDHKELGAVLILRDMRDIRAMEQQLERSRRLSALGQMAAGIAHEIRNPLGTLRGFAQYFHKKLQDDNDGQEYATLMISEVDRLNHTISALLQFARPREPEFQVIDPCQLLQRAAKLLDQDFTSQQIYLKMQCQPDLNLQADPDLLLQVLLNLLQNSLAASTTQETIKLGAMAQEEEIIIWVQDNGQGMGQEEKEKMFNPFFTTKTKGTGLGLAVSHQIIEQHHGKFKVESAPGLGTKIAIHLPTNQHGWTRMASHN